MMPTSSMDTFDVLKKLGFEPDVAVWSDGGVRLSYDFGNLTLSADRAFSRNFVEIISISGVHATRRTIAEINIQLPLRVDSIEQCAAFIVWGITNQIGKDFIPLTPTEWFSDGINNFDTLPWIKQQNLYAARPRCTVERDWLKLTLRDLRLLLPKLEESDLLSFTFQNEIFSIRSSLKSFAMPAVGNDWKSSYQITAGNFQNIPQRLNSQEIEISISIWEGHFYLANRGYPIEKATDA